MVYTHWLRLITEENNASRENQYARTNIDRIVTCPRAMWADAKKTMRVRPCRWRTSTDLTLKTQLWLMSLRRQVEEARHASCVSGSWMGALHRTG